MHYYKRNIGDYHKKAGKLSILQHGVYALLIDAIYDREKFPTEIEAIDWVWASTDEEEQAVKFVLKKFFDEENGVYVQTRIQEELSNYADFCKTQSEKGKKGGRPKEKANGLSNESQRVSNGLDNKAKKSLTTNQEPLTNNHKPSKEVAKAPVFNFKKELMSFNVDENALNAWLDIRKRKKASNSDIALNAIRREADTAGMTIRQVVQMCAENSWSGFKASWVEKASVNTDTPIKKNFVDLHTDRSWSEGL